MRLDHLPVRDELHHAALLFMQCQLEPTRFAAPDRPLDWLKLRSALVPINQPFDACRCRDQCPYGFDG